MGQLLTIFHYELLMQFKSMRFKILCALGGLIAFGHYADGVRMQELPPYSNTFFDFQSIILYLSVTSFTGLFSIGRIRSSGMHPVLMTKPFPTFTLLLAQLLAALIALLIPLLILVFPGSLLLRWQYHIDFQPLPVLHFILFMMIPLFCTVLAVTIWLRTCFKNNLIAVIILVIVFAMGLIFADKLLTTRLPDGSRVHRFVPMASCFSEFYWRGRLRVFDMAQVSFTRRADWLDWATSILYSSIFLMLGGYHLRRTEPQRKVLGHYGRRWYHAPTIMRMAFDLKIDPNVRWRHHLVLLGMAGVIFARTVQPMLPGDLAARAMAAAQGKAPDDRYDASRFPESKILPVDVHEERQTITRDRWLSEMTVSSQAETSGTMAVMNTFTRARYDMKSMTLDGKPVKFVTRGVTLYIDDPRLALLEDRGRHALRIEAACSTARQEESMAGSLEATIVRGDYFIRKKHNVKAMDSGEPSSTFDSRVDSSWPVRLELLMPREAQFISAPAPPKNHAEGGMVRYSFDFPASANGMNAIVFAPFGDYEMIDAVPERLKFRMAAPRAEAAIARQLMEMLQPVLVDFYQLHALAPAEPIVYVMPVDYMTGGSRNEKVLHEIERYLNQYRYRDYGLNDYEKANFLKLLQQVETTVLAKALSGGIRDTGGWDLAAFTTVNMARGLNHRLNMDRGYQAPEYTPVKAHLDPKGANDLANHTRTECLQIRPNWPVFQMLYLVLGHEKWHAMRAGLRSVAGAAPLKESDLQQAAEKAAGESLNWFFDYWLRDGKDLPSYKIESAAARPLELDDDGNQKYEFKARVRNLGTGRMPVPLKLTTTRIPIEEKVWIGPGETAAWTVVCRDLPKRLDVDPEGWILTKPYWSEQNKIWIENAGEAVKLEK